MDNTKTGSYTNTICSGRMYDLNTEAKETIDDTIISFNRAVYSTYNKCFLKEHDKKAFADTYGDKSSYLLVKDYAKCDTYYAHSIARIAEDKIKAQKELNAIYEEDKLQQLKDIDKKLREENDVLAAYQKTLNNLKEYRDALKKNPKSRKKLKVSKFKNIRSKGFDILVRKPFQKNEEATVYGLYSFEYDYLNQEIARCKDKISKLKYRRNNVQTKLDNLNNNPKRCVFGGKHNIKNMTHNELMDKKYKEFSVSGRSDAGSGNFVFKAVPYSKYDKLFFRIEVSFMNGKTITFDMVCFPYRGEELAKILTKDVPNGKMSPLCFDMIKKTDARGRTYYQFKVSFDIGTTKRINTDMSTGCCGLDFNFGHIDYTEIDEQGNLKYFLVIPYRVDGTTKENELSLRKAIDTVGRMATKRHKVLVVEDLDTSKSKSKSTYRDPRTNRIFHMLPYARYLEFAKYLEYKYEFAVIRVKPSYTSVIGAVKYKDSMQLTTHIAASFVIARRGMKFSHNEKVPKKYKKYIDDAHKTRHYWSKFHQIKKALEKEAKVSAT